MDDIRNIEKYQDILKKTDLIFSYGIFAYLNPSDFEKVCGAIQKHFKGYVVYNDASQKRDLSKLTGSITLSSQSYIHPTQQFSENMALKKSSPAILLTEKVLTSLVDSDNKEKQPDY